MSPTSPTTPRCSSSFRRCWRRLRRRRSRRIEPPPPTPPPPAVAAAAEPRHRRCPALPVAASAERPSRPEPPESERERLERVLKFVARQEPRLRWAVGIREDGSTLLVTDLAHGWIPPGINLPADIRFWNPADAPATRPTLLGRTTLVGDLCAGRSAGLGDRLRGHRHLVAAPRAAGGRRPRLGARRGDALA